MNTTLPINAREFVEDAIRSRPAVARSTPAPTPMPAMDTIADPRGQEGVEMVDVRDFLSNLDPIDRTIITLIMGGMSRVDAAGAVGIHKNTLMERMKRLRKLVQEK